MDVKWEFDDFKDFAEFLKDETFGQSMKKATEDITETALSSIKRYTPKDTGELALGWEGNKIEAKQTSEGYESEVVNAVPYATYVNDGHRSFNKFGGPYKIKAERRIKVKTPYEWQDPANEYYVFGHFFVERGLKSTKEKSKHLVNKRLDEWWKERSK